jgi:hypothetical protein
MPHCELDHLVIAAASLEAGTIWLNEKLGVTIPAGGRHSLMGTHNRLMQLGHGTFLELIAIDPEAPPPGRRRWFGLDDPEIQARLAREPAFLTWVARCDDIEAAAAASQIDVGPVEEGRRGHLIWQITIPRDGSTPEGGLFPTLIHWPDGRGPAANMADLGCRLEALRIRHPEPGRLAAALAAIGAGDIATIEPAGADTPPGLTALIGSPRGMVAIGQAASGAGG